MRRWKRQPNASPAQALVEFALIATVLLMLIFIVIESARILWAWNTVQNAAREGGRYAITGQSVGSNLCPVDDLPKFDDSPNGRNLCALGDNNRVASIVDVAHVGLSGLVLNETSNAFEDDNYYNIEVWGVNDISELQYDFGGLPSQPVVVRVTYRVPIITPLLRPIAASVPVFGQVALNNEAFGSLQSGGAGQGLPPNVPPIPTPGVTPSPTPSPTQTNTPTPGPSLTPTTTTTATVTPEPSVCAVRFTEEAIAGKTSIGVTGEVGATVTIVDATTGQILGTTVLLERSGHACPGYADFVPPLHPALSDPLVAGQIIEVNDNFNSGPDVRIVLANPPTATPTSTNTPAATPTQTHTPTVTPTSTPSSPFIQLLPNCAPGPNFQVTVLGFNWPDDEDIGLFWNSNQLQLVINQNQHNGSFSRILSLNGIANGTYNVRASSPSADVTAEFKVPCDNYVPPALTATPTRTPRPVDLVIVGPPEIVSAQPITAFTPVDFSVRITNTGDLDVNSQFFVDIYIDPTDVFTTHIPIEQSSGYSAVSSLAGRTSRVITITAPVGFPNAPDPHQVYGMVDSAGPPGIGQIPEPNEGNNVSQPASITGVIPAFTPTPTPTVDPSGANIIAGIVQSRLTQWVPQFRAIVTLLDGNGDFVATTRTDINGYYLFENIADGTYSVYSCIDIDGRGYTGLRTGIVPPYPVANIYMLPGPCTTGTETNQPPEITFPGTQHNLIGDSVVLQILATDPENDPLTYSAVGLPPGLTINPTTGRITGTPPNGTAGSYFVTIRANDGTNTSQIIFAWYILRDALRMEAIDVGTVTHNWQTVTTTNQYMDKVIVCTPFYGGGASDVPQIVRVRGAATGNTFEVRLQNPSGVTPLSNKVNCLVVEAGVWQMPDGRRIEANKVTSTITDNSGSWSGQAQSYGQSYTNPVVLGQVMTYNDPNWSVFWSRGNNRNNPPNDRNLYVGKHVGQDSNITRANETIGYIVVEAGSGTVGGHQYRIALGDDDIQGIANQVSTYNFNPAFSSLPTVGVLSQAAMDGNDGSWSLFAGTNPFLTGSMNLAVDEDQIGDSERDHTREEVGYFILTGELVIDN